MQNFCFVILSVSVMPHRSHVLVAILKMPQFLLKSVVSWQYLHSNKCLIVHNVVNGIVNGQNNIFALFKQIVIVHVINEIQECPVLSDKHVDWNLSIQIDSKPSFSFRFLCCTSSCVLGTLNDFSKSVISWDLLIVWDDNRFIYVYAVIAW